MKTCTLTNVAGSSINYPSPLLPPPSLEFLQSLAGLVRLSPTPCRCYRLEHSTNAKWGDWSLLDLWLLDPPQLNWVPHHLLPFPSALLPPSQTRSLPPPTPSSYHFLPFTASTSQTIHYKFICGLICEWWSPNNLFTLLISYLPSFSTLSMLWTQELCWPKTICNYIDNQSIIFHNFSSKIA